MREREQAREAESERERERERERTNLRQAPGSELSEPDTGLELTSREVVT